MVQSTVFSLSGMPQYSSKSSEETRFEDLLSLGFVGQLELNVETIKQHVLQLTKTFIDHGQHLSASDEHGDTMLHLACIGVNEELTQYLLDAGRMLMFGI